MSSPHSCGLPEENRGAFLDAFYDARDAQNFRELASQYVATREGQVKVPSEIRPKIIKRLGSGVSESQGYRKINFPRSMTDDPRQHSIRVIPDFPHQDTHGRETLNIFSMAWRNVWRNTRRSVVTIAAMTLALCVELLYAGLVTGYLQGMEDDILDLEVGDIQIFAGDYVDKPSMYTTIKNPDALLAQLDAVGYPASARLLGGGLAAADEFSAGIALRGVDVARDARVSLIGEKVALGSWLDPADQHGVVVGRRLAKTLEVKPGDELVILSQAADGSMANDLYTVRGILMGVADATDRTAIFMTAHAFRELMVFPQGVHQMIVRRPDDVGLETAAATVQRLSRKFDDLDNLDDDLDVKTWKQLMPVVANMLESTQGLILVVFFIIYVAVGILILNAMLMAVFERIREFGVLKALGAGPLHVVSLILVESAIQAGVAIVAGVMLALPGMWYLSSVGINVGRLGGMSAMGVAMRPVWYGIYTVGTLSGPLVMLVVIVFFATLYPALKAALIRPVEAMRYQ